MKVSSTALSHLETIKDDDDQGSVASDIDIESSHPETTAELSSSRDEEAEIRKESAKETARVRTWRTLVAVALFFTAVAVTATTYILLVRDEDEAYKTVFAQFARSLGDSAVRQQRDLRDAYKGLASQMSIDAMIAGGGIAKWPFFWPPMFEHTAQDFFRISKSEWIGVNNVVRYEEREAFVNFTTQHFQAAYKASHLIRYGNLDKLDMNYSKYNPFITKYSRDVGGFIEDDSNGSALVRTMQSPPPRDYGRSPNWNMNSTWVANKLAILERFPNETIFGNASSASFLTVSKDEHVGFHSDDSADHPHVYAMYPFFREPFNTKTDMVGWGISYMAFDQALRNLLPENVRGLLVVTKNTCNATFSYLIDGKEAYFQGYGDSHESKYDDLAVSLDLAIDPTPGLEKEPEHCMYSMKIYPTEIFENTYKTNGPRNFAIVVACTFMIVAVVFLMYDHMVLRRNEKMIANAAKSNAIVTSIVPDHLRDRLLDRQQEENSNKKSGGTLKTFLSSTHAASPIPTAAMKPGGSAPLADLYLEATICFADIVGFTAWSSSREPSQVFQLLETLYQSFDTTAKRRRVFKVETVGDCYVAVCGLPDPRRDHSVAMARFARDILSSMNVLTNELVVTLGPDTSDLMLRVGLHTGPVTAGVLRGERARFQLFGDTMNTCARIESSSKPNRIQCSKETADHLIKMGKGAWVQKRPEPIVLKGKGAMDGFWVTIRGDRSESVTSRQSGLSAFEPMAESRQSSTMFTAALASANDRTDRLIDWNVEMMIKLMKDIRARQMMTTTTTANSKPQKVNEKLLASQMGAMPLEEVREIVTLPHFEANNAKHTINPSDVHVPQHVKQQLRKYVAVIAGMYRNNRFHNFQHASHVLMSVIKLMSRIVPPTTLVDDKKAAHDHTFGINSDPLTRFACAFSALIHDVDHTGVSNAQLVKDQAPVAKKYKDRSVAEQNSLDLAWGILMKDDYMDLRSYLFQTQSDLVRFRQLVVNAVMSTDIVDKDLKALRNNRWDKAFKKESAAPLDNSTIHDETEKVRKDRKATIVIEHIIQASDISHTMQHWIVYRKWNQNLFEELYVAYLNGKMDQDPASFWYKGEIGFFDFYIIPLTQKLKECGVFGVSSDEFLNYALKNREEWEARGEEVVASLAEEARKKYGVKGMPRLPQDDEPIPEEEDEEDTFRDEEDLVAQEQAPPSPRGPFSSSKDLCVTDVIAC